MFSELDLRKNPKFSETKAWLSGWVWFLLAWHHMLLNSQHTIVLLLQLKNKGILKETLKKQGVMVWNKLIWIRIGSRGRFF
jgi:hypothetical protein